MPKNENHDTPISNLDIQRLQIIEDREITSELLKLKKKIQTGTPSRERSLAVTKIQEAVAWLSLDVAEIAEKHPEAIPRTA